MVSTGAVDIHITGNAGAVVATETETLLLINDDYIEGIKCPPHLAKLNLGMMIINELSQHPNWFEKGLALVESLKSTRYNYDM